MNSEGRHEISLAVLKCSIHCGNEVTIYCLNENARKEIFNYACKVAHNCRGFRVDDKALTILFQNGSMIIFAITDTCYDCEHCHGCDNPDGDDEIQEAIDEVFDKYKKKE